MSFVFSPTVVDGINKLYKSYYGIYEKYEKLQASYVTRLNIYTGYDLSADSYNKIVNGIIVAFALYWYYLDEFMFRSMCIVCVYLTFMIISECAVVYHVYDGAKTKTENFDMYINCREPLSDLYASYIHFMLAIPLTLIVTTAYLGFVVANAGVLCAIHIQSAYYINKSLKALRNERSLVDLDIVQVSPLLEEHASDERIRNAVEQANVDNAIDAVHEALKDVPAQ